MWSSILFAVFLLAISAGLIAWHVLAWRRADHGGLADADYRFYRHQFRRRLQSSALVGLVGVLSLVDLWIQDVTARVVLWCFILLIVLWALLLAGADWLASRLHFDKLLSASAVEHALLKREIEKIRREQNAKHSDP
ncbi:MAG TPA: hypothetical protein VFB96_20600 [Pirellulaceae bacterium]|nr:hypothetical protein [Pirellulaceae bacterium]